MRGAIDIADMAEAKALRDELIDVFAEGLVGRKAEDLLGDAVVAGAVNGDN